MKVNFGSQMMHVARRFADREALVNIERGRRDSFMEFHLLTNRIANMLMARFGLRRGDKYLNILENDNISLVHLPTIFKGEATCAWTNYRDSMDEHLWQIDWAQPKVVLLELPLVDDYYDPLRERGIEIVCMDPPPEEREGVHYFWDLLENASDSETGVEHDRYRDVVLFRFTGGTTGKGKCAMYTFQNWETNRILGLTLPERYCYPETRFIHLGPMSHASGLFVLAPLFMGSCQQTQNLPDLEQFCANIEAEKVTSTLLVPTVLYRLLELEETGKYDLSSLDAVLYGAAPMNPDKLRQLQARFGNIFVQVYGSTEHPAVTTALLKADHIVEKEEDAGRLASCGKVTPGVEMKIADEEGNEVAAGEVGEIWHRSPAVIPGYYNNPEATEAEIVDGWWKSGDMGTMDEKGYVYIVDRKKDMIITGGFNVYAIEVENALCSHPAVSMAAVVGIPHPDWGEAVHAEVVLRQGAIPDTSDMIDHVKAEIGRYKAPKSIIFVDALPMSVVGKVLRRKVREKYWKGEQRKVS